MNPSPGWVADTATAPLPSIPMPGASCIMQQDQQAVPGPGQQGFLYQAPPTAFDALRQMAMLHLHLMQMQYPGGGMQHTLGPEVKQEPNIGCPSNSPLPAPSWCNAAVPSSTTAASDSQPSQQPTMMPMQEISPVQNMGMQAQQDAQQASTALAMQYAAMMSNPFTLAAMMSMQSRLVSTGPAGTAPPGAYNNSVMNSLPNPPQTTGFFPDPLKAAAITPYPEALPSAPTAPYPSNHTLPFMSGQSSADRLGVATAGSLMSDAALAQTNAQNPANMLQHYWGLQQQQFGSQPHQVLQPGMHLFPPSAATDGMMPGQASMSPAMQAGLPGMPAASMPSMLAAKPSMGTFPSVGLDNSSYAGSPMPSLPNMYMGSQQHMTSSMYAMLNSAQAPAGANNYNGFDCVASGPSNGVVPSTAQGSVGGSLRNSPAAQQQAGASAEGCTKKHAVSQSPAEKTVVAKKRGARSCTSARSVCQNNDRHAQNGAGQNGFGRTGQTGALPAGSCSDCDDDDVDSDTDKEGHGEEDDHESGCQKNDGLQNVNERGKQGSSYGTTIGDEHVSSVQSKQPPAGTQAGQHAMHMIHNAPLPMVLPPGLPMHPAHASMYPPHLPPSHAAALPTMQPPDAQAHGRGPNEREAKIEKRKQSNRDSARRSRLRKQEEMGHVSVRVDHLESQNPNLSKDISAMRQAAEKLDAANAILRELLAVAKQHAETAADGSALPAQTVQLYLARLEPLQTSDFVAKTGLVSCPSNTTAWENRPALTSQQVAMSRGESVTTTVSGRDASPSVDVQEAEPSPRQMKSKPVAKEGKAVATEPVVVKDEELSSPQKAGPTLVSGNSRHPGREANIDKDGLALTQVQGVQVSALPAPIQATAKPAVVTGSRVDGTKDMSDTHVDMLPNIGRQSIVGCSTDANASSLAWTKPQQSDMQPARLPDMMPCSELGHADCQPGSFIMPTPSPQPPPPPPATTAIHKPLSVLLPSGTSRISAAELVGRQKAAAAAEAIARAMADAAERDRVRRLRSASTLEGSGHTGTFNEPQSPMSSDATQPSSPCTACSEGGDVDAQQDGEVVQSMCIKLESNGDSGPAANQQPEPTNPVTDHMLYQPRGRRPSREMQDVMENGRMDHGTSPTRATSLDIAADWSAAAAVAAANAQELKDGSASPQLLDILRPQSALGPSRLAQSAGQPSNESLQQQQPGMFMPFQPSHGSKRLHSGSCSSIGGSDGERKKRKMRDDRPSKVRQQAVGSESEGETLATGENPETSNPAVPARNGLKESRWPSSGGRLASTYGMARKSDDENMLNAAQRMLVQSDSSIQLLSMVHQTSNQDLSQGLEQGLGRGLTEDSSGLLPSCEGPNPNENVSLGSGMLTSAGEQQLDVSRGAGGSSSDDAEGLKNGGMLGNMVGGEGSNSGSDIDWSSMLQDSGNKAGNVGDTSQLVAFGQGFAQSADPGTVL